MRACVGCGGEAAKGIDSLAPTCVRCWDLFLDVFDRPVAGRSGIVVPEGPATRVADAVLIALGAPPSTPAPGRPRTFHLVPVPNPTPRRGRL